MKGRPNRLYRCQILPRFVANIRRIVMPKIRKMGGRLSIQSSKDSSVANIELWGSVKDKTKNPEIKKYLLDYLNEHLNEYGIYF
ncbi:MAG: hypothetical protein ACFFD2_11110 [Promethearchaeota archaeon]